MRALLLSLAAVGIFMALPAVAQQKDEPAAQAAEDIAAKWVQAVDRKDPAAIAALFTEDGTLLGANGAPRVNGRSEIEKAYARIFEAGFDHLTLGVSEVHMLGESAAWTQGAYVWTGRSPNGEAMERSGRWTDVIVRDGGGWKERILATNQALLPPEPMASGSTSASK